MKQILVKFFFIGMLLTVMISLVFFMQGCSNEVDLVTENQSSTKLRSLTSSSEYLILNKDMDKLGKKIMTQYTELSEEDKNKVIDIFTVLTNNISSQDEINLLFADLNSLMNINFNQEMNTLNKSVTQITESSYMKNVSKIELLTAVKEQNYKANSVPRLKSGNENDDEFTNCMNSCAITASASLLFCIGPQAAACSAAVLAVYALCCLLC